MDPGLFDMFHDSSDMDRLAIAERIDVNLNRTGKIGIQQDRAVARNLHGGADIAFQLGVVADDFHRAATKDKGGADHKGVADIPGNLERLIPAAGSAVVGLFQVQFVQKALEPLTVLGQINGVGRGAKDVDALGVQRVCQLQGRLAAELDNDAVQGSVLPLYPQDFEDMFKRKGFEIQTVRGIVVGGNRLGVAVDHNGLIARRRQRIAGMDATIVELDALPDAVGATAKDDDFLCTRRAAFAFHVAHRRHLVCGIHVGGLGLKLCRAGVDALEDGGDAKADAGMADLRFVHVGKFCQSRICETHHLERTQRLGVAGQTILANLRLHVDDFADTGQEPRVKGGDLVDLVIGQAVAHGLRDHADAVWGGLTERFGQGGAGVRGQALPNPALPHEGGERREAGDVDLVKAGQAGFEAGEGFLQTFVDRAANGHRLTHGFHRGGEVGFRAGKFLERKTRDLGHDIVDRGFKTGGRHLGDIVVQLVQSIANGEFRGDLGDGKAGGLGRQSRGAGNTGVHLDHHHAAIRRVDRPLHVRATRLYPDLAQDGDAAVAHDLIFLVGQRQSRGHSDAVAGMDAHRVDVLDRADDDGVVRFVTNHLHLEFLPSKQRLVDQNLRDGRGLKPRLHDRFIVVAVIGHTAPGAAKGIGGADDRWQADVFDGAERFCHARRDVILARRQFRGRDDRGLRVFQTDAVHRLAEQLAIFCHFYGFALGPDKLNLVLVQYAHVGQR